MYLGIDLGTSGIKALLIDEDQRIVASANATLEVSRPQAGWSEQNPADWFKATDEAMSALKSSNASELAAVKGIGLSGHMHGATLLDEKDEVLRPCILWNDTRSHLEAAELDANPKFRALSGNIVFPGFTAPKLVWVKNKEPDIFSKVKKVLLPKDYLRLWLIGDHVSEMSDSAGTSWLNVGKREWSTSLLAASDMDESQMPRLIEGSEISGKLRRELAEQWGVGSNVVVAGGAGDNAASAIGMGTVQSGSAFVSLGTSGVLFAANESYLPSPQSAVHTFCHALPNTWHQMGVILSATDALNWLSGITSTSVSDLTAELGDQLQTPGNLTFLPYLSGERTPHNDANIRGVFAGLGHESDRKAMTQAVLEGVTFAICDSLAALQKAGTELSRVTAVGGGSRSSVWLQMIATATGLTVGVPAEGDFGAAFGAARLGLIAAEQANPGEVCIPPRISKSITPDPNLASSFDDALIRYRALYPAIKGVFA